MDIRTITPDFAVTGQILSSDIPTLQAQGYTTIICNRPDDEDAGQPSADSIHKAAAAAGIAFHHIPIRPGQASGADVAAFDDALNKAAGKVLAYCRSGGRAQSLYVATGR